MIVFGPVPSRRLGYSLGINHILPKHCSYSCVYCQVGRTTSMEITRGVFYRVEEILENVDQKITECEKAGRPIEYLSLVPDGEPTLDIHLGELLKALRQFQIPIAVISNASLFYRDDVKEALLLADWVSMKVDSVQEDVWKRINRPQRSLSLSEILNGILHFRRKYHGEFVTETMLVDGINDTEEDMKCLTDFLLDLQPFKSYFSIPTRPPAESWVKPPNLLTLDRISRMLIKKVPFADFLFDAEANDFLSTGDLQTDILATIAVHPLREEALRDMLSRAGGKWTMIEEQMSAGKIVRISYRDSVFYFNASLNIP